MRSSVQGSAKRSSLFSSLAALTLLSAFLLSGCAKDDKVLPGVVQLPSTDNPSQISFHTTIRFSTDGSTRAVLLAGRIRTYDAQRYTALDSDVHVDFFNSLGIHSSILTGRRARINDLNKDMTAYDSVHIVSDSGTVVDTDSLVWHNQKQTLTSDANVRIVEKSGRVTTGLGFESDQNLSSYRILHPTIVSPKDALGTTTPGTGTSTNAMPRPLPQTDFGAPQPNTQQPFGRPGMFGMGGGVRRDIPKPDSSKH